MSWTFYELGFPRSLDLDQVVSLNRALSARPSARRRPVVFELEARSGKVVWRIGSSKPGTEALLGSVRSAVPNVRLSSASDRPADVPSDKTLGIELRLSNSMRPLRADVAGEVASGLLAVADGLRSGEVLRLQWLVRPTVSRRVARPTPKAARPDLTAQLFGAKDLDAEMARRHNDKQSEPLLATVGRLAVTAALKGRRRSVVSAALGALRLSSQPSVQLMARMTPSVRVTRRLSEIRVPLVEWPCTLNASELACLIGWPIGGPVASGVGYSGRRELPFSEGQLRDEERARPEDRVLGRATHPARPGLVVQSARDGLQHLHAIGPTGVGKSTLLANLAVADMAAGRSVVVIEPKGDLVADLFDRIPPHRLDDVVLLDPADTEQPVGLGLFSGATHRVETEVDAIVHLFRSLFAGSWGPRTQDVLHAGLLSLAHTPGMTLVELPLLLADGQLRKRVLQNVQGDPALGPFWSWFESLSDAERSQVVAPVLNKVRAFTMRSGVRRMLGQSEPRFSLAEVFTKRRIVLVPLKRGEIGPETAHLLGGLFMAQLWQATQARSRIAPERRHPVMVYLDEFQTYLHLPTSLDDVLAQARGLGLSLTLAHQHLGQLSNPELRAAVIATPRSRVVFQTGSDDAGPLSRMMGGGLSAEDLTNLGRFEAYARLVHHGSLGDPGSITTLPLIESEATSARVRERSRSSFGRPAAEVDAEIAARQQAGDEGRKSGGRRRRAS